MSKTSPEQLEKARKRSKLRRLKNPDAVRLEAKEWRLKNPEKVRASNRRTRLKNKDAIQARQKEWVNKNPEKRRAAYLKYYEREKANIRDRQIRRLFGITLEEYNERLIAQNNTCALCGGGPDAKGKMFAIDHDHKTGKIRGLLCRGCNVGMGNLKDDPELLEKAARYIRKHKG